MATGVRASHQLPGVSHRVNALKVAAGLPATMYESYGSHKARHSTSIFVKV